MPYPQILRRLWAGKALGRKGVYWQRSGQYSSGICVGPPHRYPGLKGGAGGESRSHTQERLRGMPGVPY